MTEISKPSRALGQKVSIVLALILVVVGMLNTMPEIPGLQDWARDMTARPFFPHFRLPNRIFLSTSVLPDDADRGAGRQCLSRMVN